MSGMRRGFCEVRIWRQALRKRALVAATSRSWMRVLAFVAILVVGGCNRPPDVPPYQMLIDALRAENADALTTLIPGLHPEDLLSPDEQQAMQNRECNGVSYGTNVSGSAAMFRRNGEHYKTIGFAPRGKPESGVRTEYSRQIQEVIFKDFEAFGGKREVYCQTTWRKSVHGVPERRCTAVEVRLPTCFKYDPPSRTPVVVVREFTSYGAPIGGGYSGYRTRTATCHIPWLHEARNEDADGHFEQGDLRFKVDVDESGKATVTRGKMSPPGREPADLAVTPSAVSGSSPNAPADLPPGPSAPPSAANTNAAPPRPALSPAAAEAKPSRVLPENVDTWQTEDFEQALAQRDPRFIEAIKALEQRAGDRKQQAADLAKILNLVSQIPNDPNSSDGPPSCVRDTAGSRTDVRSPYSMSRPEIGGGSFDPNHFRGSTMNDVGDALLQNSLNRLNSRGR